MMLTKPTETDLIIVDLIMRLFPNLRLRRKVLSANEKYSTKTSVKILAMIYNRLML